MTTRDALVREIEYDCHKCLDTLLAGRNPLAIGLFIRMIVCPACGNKRCPKASDHELACTGSNEPGQPGSVYARFEP